MANWLQLLAHTAEYVPGPYTATRGANDSETLVFIRAENQPVGQKTVGAILETFVRPPKGLELGEQDTDYAQEATARLLAEAPTMIELLARWATEFDQEVTGDTETGTRFEELKEATKQLLVRHVRIGCMLVDSENHADLPAQHVGNDVGEFKPHVQE